MEIKNSQDNSKPHIPIPKRWEVVHYRKMNYTFRQISEILSIPSTTCATIYYKFLEVGDVEDLEKSGRPRKTSEKEDKMLIETVKCNPSMSVEGLIEEANLDLSKTTGWRRLIENGFRNKSANIKWSMTEGHRKDYLAWTKKYIKKDKNGGPQILVWHWSGLEWSGIFLHGVWSGVGLAWSWSGLEQQKKFWSGMVSHKIGLEWSGIKLVWNGLT